MKKYGDHCDIPVSLTRRAVLGVAAASAAAPALGTMSAAPIDPAHFPTMRGLTYLDAAHRSPPAAFAIEAGQRWLADMAAGTNRIALNAGAIETARATIAQALGARPGELAFMPNTHHGLNMVLWSLGLRKGDAVIVPEQEYNGIQSIARLLTGAGMKVIASPVDRHGRIDLTALKELLERRPKAMIFSWVGFSHGARANIDAIGEMCTAYGVWCIVDGIQALGLTGRPLSSLPVDALASGSHKALMSPPGIGLLWINSRSIERLKPMIGGRGTFSTENGVGGDYVGDARRFEFGNFNQIGIAMLASSCARINDADLAQIERHISALGNYLYDVIAQSGWPIVTPAAAIDRLNIVTIEAGNKAATFHEALSARGIVVSRQETRLRFSVGSFNTAADIDRLVPHLRLP